MKHTPLRIAALLLFLALGAGPVLAADAPPALAGFYVANWNVENLYDTVDDPDNDGDDEFLPNNPTTRWTQVRYETKLDNLAQVINGMNKGNGPDVLGVEEVENEEVILDLVDRLEGKTYGIVHVDSPDPRGIDTAMLFNRKLFTLLESHAYKVSLKWDRTTRDILHSVLEDRDGNRLHVLVNHWPSRGGGIELSEPNRIAAATTLSKAVDRIFLRDPAARIVMLGDFNDEPSNRSVRDVLDAEPYPSRSAVVATNLYNLSSAKSAKGFGSFPHSFDGETEWRMYDQIMVSGALLQSARIEEDKDSFWIDRPTYMVEESGRDKGSPVPTFEGQEFYQGGYSDHFPVGAWFIFGDEAAAEPELAAEPAAPAPKPVAKPAAPAKESAKPKPVPPAKPAAPALARPAQAKPAPPAQKKSRPAAENLDEPVLW